MPTKSRTIPPQNGAPTFAVVIPTYNEAENLPILVERLSDVLDGVAYEVIFVDDHSPDGTADIARSLARADTRVRCLERIGRRGLSTAVIEGILSTSAEYVAVMDADLQHDETLLPDMLDRLRDGADLVVGSRYVDGGGTGDWDASRVRSSHLATRLSRMLKADQLSDPMSGFFATRTALFRQKMPEMTGTGYKILLDFVATPGEPLQIVELPYQFRSRTHGESKLDSRVMLEFFELLLAKSVGRYVPTKFVMFSLVGALGVAVHFLALSLTFGPLEFGAAQAVAAFIAMTVNFFVNNVFTYSDRRIRGWGLVPGWFSFCLASSVGLLANVGVAVYIFSSLSAVWYLSALAGIIVGAAWNFAATALYTWKV